MNILYVGKTQIYAQDTIIGIQQQMPSVDICFSLNMADTLVELKAQTPDLLIIEAALDHDVAAVDFEGADPLATGLEFWQHLQYNAAFTIPTILTHSQPARDLLATDGADRTLIEQAMTDNKLALFDHRGSAQDLTSLIQDMQVS